MSTAPESNPPNGSGARSSNRSRGGPSNRRGGGPSSSRGGGRRANFGGSLTSNNHNGNNNNNRNRGANHSRANRSNLHATAPAQDSAQDDQASGTSDAASTEPVAADATAAGQAEDDDELPPEADVCFICADPIKLTSIAPCDHRTCHICALRLRVLYKKDECTFCKSKIDRLIFTSSSTKNFADFKPQDIPYTDKKLPISFETKEALEETVLLLRFNCPDPNCEVACTGWKDYKAHVRREHNRLVCPLCITHKKIFAHEHTLHTEQSLAAHEKAEHRLCEYDRLLFYSDDELFAHMRDRHEQCHICKARGGEEERWKYYRDYDMLEKHFRRDHWLCENKECLEEKFIVFDSEMDFKAHQLDRHSNELSSRERREAVRIEANFSYDDGGESSRSGANRGGGGGGVGGKKGGAKSNRSGNNNGESSSSSTQPRDILGVSSLASRSHVPGAGPASAASRRAMFDSNLTSPTPQGISADRTRTVSDTHSTEEKHQAYMDKVSSTLSGSDARIAAFRSSVRAFKNGESSARDLISTMHSLVGEMDDCAPLVNGLLDLLDDKDKAKALGDAWNVYRVETSQFPSLTPGGGAAGSSVVFAGGSGYAGAGSRGGQVRSIKKSSAASSSQVWANVERAASASSGHGAGRPVALREHFPSLGTLGTSSGTPSIPGSLAHAVAHSAASRSAAAARGKWGAAVVSTPSATTSAPKPFVASVHSSGGGRSVNTASSAAFPSLPSNAAKASLNAHKKALFEKSSGPGSAEASGASTPWSAAAPGRIDEGLNGGGLEGLREALVAEAEGEGRRKGKGKGKGKGVQVLAFGGVHRG